MSNIFAPFEDAIANRHRRAQEWKEKHKGKRVAGYLCCSAPEEIIFAGGHLPVRIVGGTEVIGKVDDYIPHYACHYARRCLDLSLGGVYDYLDNVVVNNTCDVMAKMEFWWRLANPHPQPTIAGVELCPYLLYINYPEKVTGRKVLEFLTHELRKFMQCLERAEFTTYTDDMLRKAIEVYNEHYGYMERLRELRRQEPPLVSGYEAWMVECSSLFMPKDEHNALMKAFLKEVPNRQDKPKPAARLYLTGSAIDPVGAKLYKMIEEAGGQVVSEDISSGSSYFWTKIDTSLPPLQAIAQRTLDVRCPRSTTSDPMPNLRLDFIKKTADGFGLQGVVVYNLSYCECRALENPLIKEKAKEWFNIPTLFLEGEYTDESLEECRGRIEAFVEMLEG